MARGVDFAGVVDHVISYDSPLHVKTHVHRIGRTARGGLPGHALTLLLPSQVSSFHSLRTKTLHSSLGVYKPGSELQELVPKYQVTFFFSLIF